jgi:hypothetical protein
VGGGLGSVSVRGGAEPGGYGAAHTVSKGIGGAGARGDGVGRMMGIRGKEAGDNLDVLQMLDSTGHDHLSTTDVSGHSKLVVEQMVCSCFVILCVYVVVYFIRLYYLQDKEEDVRLLVLESDENSDTDTRKKKKKGKKGAKDNAVPKRPSHITINDYEELIQLREAREMGLLLTKEDMNEFNRFKEGVKKKKGKKGRKGKKKKNL